MGGRNRAKQQAGMLRNARPEWCEKRTWVKDPVDHVLNTPELSDTERIAILGANAAKLMKVPV